MNPIMKPSNRPITENRRLSRVISVGIKSWLALLRGVFQQSSYLLAQLGAVGMSMCGYRMLRCSLKHFLLRSFDAERTSLFAWMKSAINRFSLRVGHGALLGESVQTILTHFYFALGSANDFASLILPDSAWANSEFGGALASIFSQ